MGDVQKIVIGWLNNESFSYRSPKLPEKPYVPRPEPRKKVKITIDENNEVEFIVEISTKFASTSRHLLNMTEDTSLKNRERALDFWRQTVRKEDREKLTWELAKHISNGDYVLAVLLGSERLLIQHMGGNVRLVGSVEELDKIEKVEEPDLDPNHIKYHKLLKAIRNSFLPYQILKYLQFPFIIENIPQFNAKYVCNKIGDNEYEFYFELPAHITLV